MSSASSTLLQVAELDALDLPTLRERWRWLFGAEAPPYNRRFLVKRLAYRLQELAHGGISSVARARMESLAQEAGLDEEASLPGRGRRAKERTRELPIAGTLLVREWSGRRHEVLVTRSGFEYEGLPYRSLSAIAKAITGTHWNGWAFFGVRRPSREQG